MSTPSECCVCVDTNIWIWSGIRDLQLAEKSADLEIRTRVRQSRMLLHDLQNKRCWHIVPSIVLSELLCGVEPGRYGDFIARMTSSYHVPTFDIPASKIAATLVPYGKGLANPNNASRVHLKADAMIVATAKVHGVKVFYSHDERCRRLAEKVGMKALDLPSHSEDLFTNIAAESDELDPPDQLKVFKPGK